MQDEERKILTGYWEQAAREEADLLEATDPIRRRFRLVEFVSRREWGAERKNPREVRLLVVNGVGAVDLLARSHRRRLRADSYAEAALREAGEEPDGRAVERVIEILEGRNGRRR